MGLLDLFLQNQSNLDINPVPPQGNGPIEPATGEFNTGVAPFQQVWNSSNTYIDNFNPNIQPNTLGQTGLDNTNPNFIPSTTLPTDTTVYPNLATGEFNSVSNLYTQIYGPNQTYLDNFNPNTQPNSLQSTGLDIENIGLVSTTAAPSPNTSYPNLSTGEFNGQSNNFNQTYTPNNTYLNTFNPNTQPNTVLNGETGLDNINSLAFNTTFVPNAISSPTDYPSPPQTFMGEFQGAPSQFTPLYTPNPGQSYLDNYSIIISNAGNQQINTLGQTDLDNSNNNSSPTTVQNVDPTVYPLFVQGEFNSSPNLFNQIWSPNFGYYENSNPSAQIDTLSQTGLDVENQDAVPTAFIPNTSTSYPSTALGGLGQSALQFIQIWNPIINYNDIVVGAPVSPLEQSLDETGLDIENEDAVPTTYIVPQTDNITIYPPEVTGELGSAPSQYSQEWKPINKYYNFMKENYQAQ
jgi:hypothetical protein